jgi:ribose transport system substrate-binding protein
MKKFLLAFVCIALLAIPSFAAGTKESGVIKIGVSIPSADHGWTGGIVWWSNKAVKDIQAASPANSSSAWLPRTVLPPRYAISRT